jgi:hypothetical protein
MNILLILLGCNISYLLNNRIETAIQFVGTFNETNINWFLSGGIKNPNDDDAITEAEKMAQQISTFEKMYTDELTGNKWNYIYDTTATNTAENFIMARNFINGINTQYDDVYVITSKFHHNRANKISEKILDIKPKWILGDAELHDSYYWENIHIKNVDSDVNKALNKFQIKDEKLLS